MDEVNREATTLDMRFTDFLWFIAFNVILFSGIIGDNFGFTYADELMVCIVALIAAVQVLRDWVDKELMLSAWGLIAFFSLLLFTAIGLYGNFLWGIQASMRAVVIDVFTCIKFPLLLMCSLYLFRKVSIELLWMIEREVKALVAVMLILAVANLFVNFGMAATDLRYGIRAFQFICNHPTGLVAMGVALALVLLRDPERNRWWIVTALLVIASSLRSKGIVFCVLTLILMFVMRGGRKLSIGYVIICIVIAILIGWNQFISYFASEGFARTELARTSLKVASDYFPIGSGFATFGSYVSGESYSPLYYKYDLSNVWGLEPGHTSFLSDTFWPTVVGQFGFLGLGVYVLLIGSLFKLAYDMAGNRRIVVICCFAYLLISSTSESAFFHPLCVSLAFTLGMMAGDADGIWDADHGVFMRGPNSDVPVDPNDSGSRAKARG